MRTLRLAHHVFGASSLLSLLTALTAQGCSANDGNESQAGASALGAAAPTAPAAGSTPSQGTTTCSAADVAWPAGASDGPCAAGVYYEEWNDCDKSIPASYSANGCPEHDIQNPSTVTTNTCWWTATYGDVTHTATLPTKLQCGLPTKPPCKVLPTTTCEALGEADLAAIRAGKGTMGGAGNSYNFGTWTSYNDDAVTNGLKCSWVIHDYPYMQDSPNAFWCGTTTTPVAPTPFWPACTIQSPDTCGTSPGYLAPGSKVSQVPNPATSDHSGGSDDGLATVCISEESMPVDTAAHVQAKFDALIGNLARVVSGASNPFKGVNGVPIVAPEVDQLKLVFELYGDWLTAAQQAAAVQLYFTYPSTTPGCGMTDTGFVPPVKNGCTADPALVSKIDGEMTFCSRLTDHHVRDAVRGLQPVVDVCVKQLAADVGQLRPTLLAKGFDDGTANAVSAPGTDAGASTSDANDACAFKTYRADYDAIVSGPITARFEANRDPRVATDQPEILARLAEMDAWYTAITTNLYPYVASEPYATAVQRAGWKDAAGLEGAFWRGIYRQIFSAAGVMAADGKPITALPDGGLPEAGALPPTFGAATVASLTQDTLDADRAVLGMLFPVAGSTAAPPMSSGALLMVLGDALEAMSQRMSDIGVYHDMGCAYLGCGAGAQTELVLLTRLLAAIPDSTALNTALTDATRVNPSTNQPAVRAMWSSVYSALLARHATLEAAVKSAQSGGGDWAYAASGEPALVSGASPGPTQHLAGLVQKAQSATTTYAATGLFNPTARNRLPAGIAQDNVDAIRGDINTRATALQQTVAAFDANLTTLANAVVQEMSSNTGMTNSKDQLAQRWNDIQNVNANIAGLRASLAANAAGLSSLAGSYAASVAYDPNVLLTTSTYGPWTFDASSATAPGPIASPSQITSFARPISASGSSAPATFSAGTIVTIQTGQGQAWAPTCALQTTTALGGIPTGSGSGTIPLKIGTSLTGPSGYTVSLNDTGATASNTVDTTSRANTASVGASIQACGGYTAPLNIYSVQVCAHLDDTESFVNGHSVATSNTSTSTSSAAFAGGMRLENTPIPSAPVGALLAIITDAGSPDVVRDIRVVDAPATTLVMPASSNVYLLTNDIKSSSCTIDTQDGLSVGVSTAQHAGSLDWVQKGLASVEGFLGGLIDGSTTMPDVPAGGIAAQGIVTPDQAAEIRSTAMVKLVQACNADATVTDKTLCDTSKLPTTILQFLNNYVDRSIERIELQVQIIQEQRALNGLSLVFQQMMDDYDAAQSQADVGALIPEWTLRNLDTQLLQAETAQLVQSATYDLYPVLQLRYPDVFAQGLSKDLVLQSALQTLSAAQWDQPVTDLANAASKVATELYNDTQSLATTYPPVTPKVVALDYVRPGVTVTQPQYWQVLNSGVFTQASTGNHVIDIHINPEDIYHSSGGFPGLLCTEEVPVIRDFAVVLAGSRLLQADVDLLDNRNFSVASSSDSSLEFPTAATYDANDNLYSAGGPLSFTLKNLDWASLDTEILASIDPGRAVLAYNTARSDTTKFMNGKGLSPFTDFKIDLSPLYDKNVVSINQPVELADHLVVVMAVEYRQVAANKTMSWISTCK